MTTEEGLLKIKVKRYLDQLPRMFRYMPVPSGWGAQTLDFLCCINGRFVGIETKSKGKKPTPRQEQCMTAIKAAGGAAFWCDDFESFLLGMAAYGLVPQSTKDTIIIESTAKGFESFEAWKKAQPKSDWS